ncbi:hypothetical protein KUTeg_011784, partial [Tegillarca granosa]
MDELASDILQLDYLIERRNAERATEDFVKSMKNPNTVRKTTSDIKKFTNWLKSQNEQRELHEMQKQELDRYLARFFMTAKKVNGEEFEPDSLKTIQSSINRHLSEMNAGINIIEDNEFKHSRDVLSQCHITYKYNVSEQCYIFWNAFTTRTCQLEMVKRTSNGEKFLEYTERSTKTRTGVTSENRAFTPKMFEDRGNPRCPVYMYQLYAEKRPDQMKLPDSPFYIGINKRSNEQSEFWFVNQAMGKNTFAGIVKTMCDKVNITGRKVNHSARKTGITTLVHAGMQNTLIQQQSGHKSLSSLNNYSTASLDQQKQMSCILSNLNKPSTLKNASSTATTRSVNQFPVDSLVLNNVNKPSVIGTVTSINQFSDDSSVPSHFKKQNLSCTSENDFPDDFNDLLLSNFQELIEQTLRDIEHFEGKYLNHPASTINEIVDKNTCSVSSVD